jgi:hypothetical protein
LGPEDEVPSSEPEELEEPESLDEPEPEPEPFEDPEDPESLDPEPDDEPDPDPEPDSDEPDPAPSPDDLAPDPAPSSDDLEPEDDLEALELPRSFFAQPDPLKWIVGGANSLRIVPSSPHEGQKSGPGSFRPWRISVRWSQVVQAYS